MSTMMTGIYSYSGIITTATTARGASGHDNGIQKRKRTRGRRVFPLYFIVYVIIGIVLRIRNNVNHNYNNHYNNRYSFLFADAFPSHLITSGIGCMTELSTEENIMNNRVTPPENSDYPKMYLAVLDENDRPIETKTYKYDPSVRELRIAFVNPYMTSVFNEDLHFAMEVSSLTTITEEGEYSRDAEFVDGGTIGCENNRRMAGRLMQKQASAFLQINNPSARLRVWAGWATGHESVRLVPDLILEPDTEASTTERENDNNNAAEDLEELEEELLEEQFQSSPLEKLVREEEKEKLNRLLEGDGDESSAEAEDEKEREELEELEEELREEEFQNSPREKLQREREEEKLEKLLEADDHEDNKPKLKRKRKNVLQKPEHLPDGWIDPKKRSNNLGIEIARTNRDTGRQRAGVAEGGGVTKSIREKLADKQFDLHAAREQQRQKRRHKLMDHVVDRNHREIRDAPEAGNEETDAKIYDDETDDDLPEVHFESTNDDELPDEGEIDDVQIYGGEKKTVLQQQQQQQQHVGGDNNPRAVLETPDHFVACAFFAGSMGLFLLVFGKKRDKGRRDL